MSDVLAIVPARAGSKGIPGKNFRELGGLSLVERAVYCARDIGAVPVVSSDLFYMSAPRLQCGDRSRAALFLARPPDLAQDDTPMLAVVQHVLEQVPGPPDEIIVLLQPTQPFRTPGHVQAAIALLRETQADSVVSVRDIGTRDDILHIPHERLEVLSDWGHWETLPACRQGQPRSYRRDGTVYAFWRKTVSEWDTIYGIDVCPLIIPAEESCELDTEADWAAVSARWVSRHGAHA